MSIPSEEGPKASSSVSRAIDAESETDQSQNWEYATVLALKKS